MNIHFAFLWLSFSECYVSELGPLAVSEEGEEEGSVPLEHLITCIPGINIVTAQNGFKVIKWIHNKPPASNTGTDLTRSPNPRGELHWKPLFRLAEESPGVHKSNTNLQNLNPIVIKNGNPYRIRPFSRTVEDTREAIRIVSYVELKTAFLTFLVGGYCAADTDTSTPRQSCTRTTIIIEVINLLLFVCHRPVDAAVQVPGGEPPVDPVQ